MMNRKQRRAVGLRGPNRLSPGVSLIGGPMAGWYVKPDAPALYPTWWTHWPDSVRAKWQPGRYEAVPSDGSGITRAQWTEFKGGTA